MSAFPPDLADRLHAVMDGHVAAGEAGGLAWLARRDGEVVAGTAGALTRRWSTPPGRLLDHRLRRADL